MTALEKIKAWRRVLSDAMVERGLKRASGRQNEGNEHYLPSVALKMSRITECSVYGGRRIPLPPVYLTVETAIHNLSYDSASERESFRVMVFNRLRTVRSLDSDAVGPRQRELGLALIEALQHHETAKPILTAKEVHALCKRGIANSERLRVVLLDQSQKGLTEPVTIPVYSNDRSPNYAQKHAKAKQIDGLCHREPSDKAEVRGSDIDHSCET